MPMNKLVLENFSLAFGSNVLFKNLNYEFTPGIYIFHGPSGVGKSSLMRCIAGLNTDYTGKIILNDQTLKGTNSLIHMVHQHYTSYPWLNCIDNVLMVYKGHRVKITPEVRKQAVDILTKLGLQEHLKKKPFQLSGGQDQRLSIGSALINDMSPVILYDEMTSALDNENDFLISKLVKEHQQRVQNIIIVITHEEHVAEALGGKIIDFSESWRIN